MDFNIVALEISDLIAHFDYFDRLVTESLPTDKSADSAEDQAKFRKKNQERLTLFFVGANFYNRKKQLRPIDETKGLIIPQLEGMKNKDIHELVEKLAKDAKKMKKLYQSLTRGKNNR